MNRNEKTARSCLALLVLAAAPKIMAQAAPKAPTTTASADDETIELSPFTVSSTSDSDSYLVRDTLAGSRVRTDLKDVATSLSVVTSKFLQDTGARNNQDLLVYTANTEVGGVYGNYAGVGTTFTNGASENSFTRPNQNTRVRGLDSADNSRDYFQTDIPWDSYIVDRVDLQRGPNSILFGVGSPAGIINASINQAGYRTKGKFENRLGSFGSFRNSFDYNQVILKNELSVRIALLDDDTKYRQEPAFNRDRRVFAAVRLDPKIFNSGSAHTTITANYEHGKVNSNLPRILPPEDRITPFFAANAINKQTFDPYQAWQWGYVPYSNAAVNKTVHAGAAINYWLVQYQGPGVQGTANPQFVYDSITSSVQKSARQASPTTYWGVNSSGVRDGGIDGFPYGSLVGIAGYHDYAIDVGLPAADKGFYKDKSLTDTSIFDFYNKLIDGPNAREWRGWDAVDVAFNQTFLNNRIAFQAVYDYQKYHDGQERNLGSPFIGVDILKNLAVYPWAYTDIAVANPNAGRAFVGSSAKNGGNNSSDTSRKNVRLSLYGELHATDLLDKSLLTDILGYHKLNLLYSKEHYNLSQRSWVRYAVDASYSQLIGNGPSDGANGGLANGDRVIDWITYLSGDLRSRASASGLNLDNIKVIQSPSGTVTIPYFDSHWTATGVDPAKAWYNPAREENSTESENPRNYAGWKNGTFQVLNADQGDRDRLLTEIANVQQKTRSEGGTWQGYFWNDSIVATVGYRKDRKTIESQSAQYSPTQNGLGSFTPGASGVSEDASRTWGVVFDITKAAKLSLPYGTSVSLSYSNGRNTRVENRYGFDGTQLPNAKGTTKDAGVIISSFNDRLMLKITHYKTTVKDANITSVTTEASTLGSNTYYLRNLEAWGTASALLDLAGPKGAAVGWEWYWNWALVDHGFDGAYNDVNSALYKNDPSTIKEYAAVQSWLSQMLPQSWFDAYGFPVNVAKAKAGDYAGAIANWTPTSGVGGVQPAGGGRINGVWPTGTVDNESKGWEFELVGEPIKGWSISANASKTMASQTALGKSLSDFIEASYKKYQSAAGDLRLWWGGDKTVRQYYTENIWSAYQFQLNSSGRLVPEMSPWRVNLTTNYTFNRGALKGFNVGGAYRWVDHTIIGYALNDKKDNLDVNRPYWAAAEDHIDLWVGYERKLTEKVNWRIQANVRNAGERPNLRPISVQPDGSAGAFRIQEGFTWQLTNTFSF